MGRPRFWVSFILFFVLLAVPFGMLGFLVGFGSAMMTWGMPPTGAAAAVLAFLAGFPLRIDSPLAWVFNGVCWGAAPALLLALRAKLPERRKREARGFPVTLEPSSSRGHEWGKRKR
jgi:hypothetical protein